ncbi:hypothetical protein [Paenibacillus macquariensis]|uniref:Uncharacterized protein n=1 Tax=Paenibacillus macquariensis TaxID=948756 RepID=A0ABY1JNZ9_9BACL|nr:hypothetical protein [Paenibacillus macquariensis]MEC0092082.1 hypothetical protein [Paenibacillus macquariensis]OAB37353.1 hypothetical protein PMSM_04610 [Paenibacillus macquariensis subsp. macquariensis]SIQ51438.1 hypothetical protein SAMN05421578_102349 [Paenibacillus macquariensis]
MHSPKFTEGDIRKWIGYPVCAVLKDGSYIVGKVIDVKDNQLVIAGLEGEGKLSSHPNQREKAKVSGMLDMLFGGKAQIPLPAGAIDTPSPTSNGIGKIMPGIRVGIGVLQYVWPLMGKFFV